MVEENTAKAFKVVTLGCRTNQYESQGYQDQLLKLGFHRVDEGEKADLCIVNTCTVTESADSSSRHAIRKMAKDNPGAKIVVTGCFADRAPEKVAEIPGVSLVVPNKEKEALVNTLFPSLEVPEFSIKHFDAHTRAFVKVQDGCNSFCTYCIIPYVRGRSRSREVKDILKEVEGLVKAGFKEVVITGINVGDFDGGKEEKVSLATLIKEVDQIDGLKRLRVSSIDPDEVDDALMDAIIHGKNTCHSMHIVLQSGSNLILKRMNRKYTRQIFLETIERLKNASKEFTFTTDVIVGFPGETESDFQETLSVMEEVCFAKVHMFPYSDRPRTRSSLMPGKIKEEVIRERKHRVLELAEKAAFRLREKFIGKKMTVLLESEDAEEKDTIAGHTSNFLEVRMPKRHYRPNDLVDVVLQKNTPGGFLCD